MELKQETVKQIRGLIIFTAVLIVCLWKFDVVISAFQFVLNIVYPFLLGGAIAFALSVPMNFVERKLFTERKISEKYKRKYARGISLMLVIAGVTGILAMIIFGLLPQLAGTFANLGKSIQEFIPQVQGWADHWFHNNKEIMNVVNNLEFDWNVFYCICIRSLYFAAERETGKTGEKSIICVCQEGESRSCIGSAGSDV